MVQVECNTCTVMVVVLIEAGLVRGVSVLACPFVVGVLCCASFSAARISGVGVANAL